MRHLSIVLTILILVSCKLFQDKDTTDPIVNLTIEGGNEISREVTLYLDIEDDSEVDYAQIMIDDTTALTVESHFDTIRFDVTPFADESEHQLFARVADSEGNIGESEKLDVVITEFPGWRIYNDYLLGSLGEIKIDENGLIWIYEGSDPGIKIIDLNSNEIRELSTSNSDLPQDIINDIQIIEGSRVWIATDDYICVYHYGLNKWIKIINIDEVDIPYGRMLPLSLLIDKNYDLYIGNWDAYFLTKYDGANFSFYELDYESSWVYHQRHMALHPNGSIFISGSTGIDMFKNGVVTRISDISGQGAYRTIIDSSGIVWTNSNNRSELVKYENETWSSIDANIDDSIEPLLVSTDNILYFILGDYRTIMTLKGSIFTIWSQYDTPFNSESYFFHGGYSNQAIAEAPNGDVWMIANGDKLLRYRPSLGGYP